MPVRRPKRKSKVDQTLTESRDATQNMVALLQDADSAGQKTMTMLHEQGEQLNRYSYVRYMDHIVSNTSLISFISEQKMGWTK